MFFAQNNMPGISWASMIHWASLLWNSHLLQSLKSSQLWKISSRILSLILCWHCFSIFYLPTHTENKSQEPPNISHREKHWGLSRVVGRGGNKHSHLVLSNMSIKTGSLRKSNLRISIRIQNMCNYWVINSISRY